MNTHLIALQLMAVQGILGAFDTIFHHELTEALPRHRSARTELWIHATRALIYSVLFAGLSGWEWHGAWAVVLLVLFAIEIILTLWDFVIEDRSRLLPATERVAHTVLAINGGAFITLLALNTPGWFSQPAALVVHRQGALGIVLLSCGLGVGLSGVRDGLAAHRLGQRPAGDDGQAPRHFGQQPERVLVSGGSGFIGRLLVRALLSDGHQVTVLTRSPRKTAWLFDGRVRCIATLDELSPGGGVDVVINLAGARILGRRWTAARKAMLLGSRVDVTQALVRWMAAVADKPRLFISASAVGYYGIQPPDDEQLLTEASPPQPIFMSQLCQRWEAAASAASQHGVTVTLLRFGLVLGRGGALPMMMLPIQSGLGGQLGSGRQWFSWIHLQDLLRAIAHVWPASPGTAGVYNVTAPHAVTQHQFSQIAARAIRRPCVLRVPGRVVRLLLGEQADLLLEGQRVAPARLQAEGFQFAYPDLLSAIRNLH